MRVAALCPLVGLLVALEGVAADSISGLKCSEYARHVKRCAADYDMGLFVGKKATKPREFPHMAHVGYEGEKLLCGGILVSPSYVLTSAVCATSQNGPAFVLLGEDDSSPQKIRVVQSLPHPDYKEPRVYNDIALLRLDKAATITDHVRPACLHRGPALEAGDIPIATGWGRSSLFDSGPSEKLMKVALPVVAHGMCNREYTANPAQAARPLPHGILDEKQICAGGGKSDTCQGDSGGPLQVLVSSPHCTYQIVGITSFGKACNSGSPGVYTRVSPYVPWIESVVWP